MKIVAIVIIFVLGLMILGVYLFIWRPDILEKFLTTSVMTITSPDFENNRFIPPQYTCDGNNLNPTLIISEVPAGAKSLALIMDDPDAPGGAFVHWVIWNIDPMTKRISENSNPKGIVEGTNSSGKTGYLGPCPPAGTHRYLFKLYALDSVLDIAPGSTKENLLDAMRGRILTETQLLGFYGRIK